MKKLLSLALATIMCLSLFACGKKDDTTKPDDSKPGTSTEQSGTSQQPVTPADPKVTYKEQVLISVSAENTTTGYYSSTSQPASYLGRMTHEPLYRLNYETNELEKVLAEDAVDVNGDGKTWKVTLKQGVKFINKGVEYAELKASDVKFTFEFIAPNGPAKEAGVLVRNVPLASYVESLEVTGDYEVVFHLNTALFDFPANTPLAYILSEKAVKEFGNTEGQEVGTGTYYINYDKVVRGQKWVMTRNELYWGGLDNHPTKEIVFVIHTDENTGAAALQAGEVDALFSSTPTVALQFQNNPSFTVHSVAGQANWFLGYNSYDGTGFFDNEDDPDQIKLRQAINMGINRDEVVQILFAVNPSSASPVHGMFGKSTYGYVDCGEWEYNVEKAKGMMAELGYTESKPLKLILCYNPAVTTDLAQIMQDQLKKINIQVELAPKDSSQFGSFLRSGQGWDLFLNYYSTATPMTQTMSSHIASTGTGAKTQGWNSAVCDEKIANILAQPTADAQLKAFAEFQEFVFNYHPRLPIYCANNMIEAKAELEGVVVCPDFALQDFTTFRIPA